jgi:hypothetical protein
MPVELVEENARRLSEDILGDPDDIWSSIVKYSEVDWENKFKVYKIHRFPKRHMKVWLISQELVARFAGDSRKIWTGRLPDDLYSILPDLAGGNQLSRMIIGALIDTNQINGSGNIKADTHVKKVLGRAISGRGYSGKDINEITNITRTMYPPNPWLLDQPLYTLGLRFCFKSDPRCERCCLREECSFHNKK